MIVRDHDVIRFRVGFAARWRANAGVVTLGWISTATGIADLVNLITDPGSVTTLGQTLDRRGRSVAVWNLDPLIGRPLQAWLGAVGIDGTITRSDDRSDPSPAEAGRS
ncbi:MAG: hypothetical protein M3Y91_01995 [Actinomycetota bacterium]|nr:hypothetical protein [Actinomycetota bacterium]